MNIQINRWPTKFLKNFEKRVIPPIYISRIPGEFFKELYSDTIYDLFILEKRCSMANFSEDDLENQLTENQIRRLNNGKHTGEVLYEKIRENNKYKTTPVIFHYDVPLKLSHNTTMENAIQIPTCSNDLVAKRIKELLTQ